MAIRRILIIDDDIEFSEELAESLKEEGYFADCTSDPFKGEELIRSDGYDTVLLDYKMPGLSGIDILKKLKAHGIRKRIFIVTGKPLAESALKEENLSDAISGIISKPIDFGDLLEKIKGGKENTYSR